MAAPAEMAPESAAPPKGGAIRAEALRRPWSDSERRRRLRQSCRDCCRGPGPSGWRSAATGWTSLSSLLLSFAAPSLSNILRVSLHLRLRYPVEYNAVAVEVRQTDVYARWFRRLRDRQARVRIDSRIRRLSLGNPGDVRPVGGGVSEIRIDYGPGYRVYFVQRGEALVVLLAGGDKDSQQRDIRTALELAQRL